MSEAGEWRFVILHAETAASDDTVIDFVAGARPAVPFDCEGVWAYVTLFTSKSRFLCTAAPPSLTKVTT